MGSVSCRFCAFFAGRLLEVFPVERIPVVTHRSKTGEIIVAGFFAKKRLQKLQDSVTRNFQRMLLGSFPADFLPFLRVVIELIERIGPGAALFFARQYKPVFVFALV